MIGPALEEAGHELVGSEADAEAMVDFTAPAAAEANVLRALAAGLPCVVGTTGWDVQAVDAAAREAGLPVFVAPNFAIGAVLMMRFAAEASRYLDAAEIIELHHETKLDAPSGTAIATAKAMEGDVPIHSVRLPGFVAHQEVILGGPGQTLTIRHDTTSREAFVAGCPARAQQAPRASPGRDGRAREAALSSFVDAHVRVGDVDLALSRPADPEDLLDEDAFANDEFLPYWAELWPAGLALARALPANLTGLTVVELGCGLGVPSLVAAARGAHVTATDWASDAIELLSENASRNGLALEAKHADWRDLDGTFDLVLAADLLYERRNVAPLVELLPRLAPEALVALAGRPYEDEFLAAVDFEQVAERIVRVRRPSRARRPAAPGR